MYPEPFQMIWQIQQARLKAQEMQPVRHDPPAGDASAHGNPRSVDGDVVSAAACPRRVRIQRAVVLLVAVVLTAALAAVITTPARGRTDDGRPGRAHATLTPMPTPSATASPSPSPTASPPPEATRSPSPTPTPESSGYPIAYADSYWTQLALFPNGWANNGCEVSAVLSGGGGVCETIIDPVYLYPDGTWGSCPWIADPASPTGWSVDEAACVDPGEGF